MKKLILFLTLLFVGISANAQLTPVNNLNYVKFLKVPPTGTPVDQMLVYDSADQILKMRPVDTENREAVNDVNKTITGTSNRLVAYTAITADRTVTLPPATTSNQRIWITDESGSCSNARRIIVAPSGSDVIGGDSFSVINFPNGSGYLESNGAGRWNIISTTAVQFSSGVNTLPSYTDNGNGSVTIGTGVYSLYANTTGVGRPKAYQIAGGTFTLTDNSTNYIYAQYNTTTGAVSLQQATTDAVINDLTTIPVYSIYRQGLTLHPRDFDTQGVALANKLNRSIQQTQKVRIVEGGVLLGETTSPAVRTVTVTAGTAWVGGTEISLVAVNSASNTCYRIYPVAGVYQTTTVVTQYDNQQYSDGTNLQTLTTNNYGVRFIYRSIGNDNDMAIVVGTGNNSLGQAQVSVPPANLPAFLRHMTLVGRIIFKKGDDFATQIDQVTGNNFATAGVTDHNALNNLQTAQAGATYGHITDGAQTIAGDKTLSGNLTANSFNDNIIDARKYANLNDAVTAIGSAVVTLLISNNQTTNANLTIPINISMKIIKGGSITKNSTNTIDINGFFDAGIYKVFNGYSAGDIKFGKAVIKEVYPQWWGENTTPGTTNMTLPIQSSISSLVMSGGTVKIPIGLYLVDALTIPYSSGVFRAITIEGDGKWNLSGSTIFHKGTELISNSAVPIFAPVNNSDGITLKNIVLNGNNIGAYGWYGQYGAFVTIENCIFTKFINTGCYINQGLFQLRSNYFNLCSIGAELAGDGVFSQNRVVDNTGHGVIFNSGGNFFSENEITGNGGSGLYINGTTVTNSNTIVSNNYFENNKSWNIFAEGQSSGNRTVSKLRITGNYLSVIAVPNGNTTGGIKLLNIRTSNIANNNFIGSSGGNLSEQNVILLQNSDMVSISNLIGENGYRNALKIIGSEEVNITAVNFRDFAQSTTASDDAYGIFADANCRNIKISNVNLIDKRGASGYMKGIKSLFRIFVTNYRVSTPISNPDSFFGGGLFNNPNDNGYLDISDNNGVQTFNVDGTSGSIKSNSLSGTGTRTVVADASGNLSATSTPPARPYLVYTALISQSGTSAPTATVLENTLGVTLTWAYSSVGAYSVTSPSPIFLSGKTAVLTTINYGGSGFGWVFPGSRTNDSAIGFITANDSGQSDGRLNGSTVEIRVYP